ncbi:hypothetical protein ColKHC_06648 [Colletotrichum higginsianum]|nr:hypothetical protein ColKHC_06648 [Colletotrichum higginsianum]
MTPAELEDDTAPKYQKSNEERFAEVWILGPSRLPSTESLSTTTLPLCRRDFKNASVRKACEHS